MNLRKTHLTVSAEQADHLQYSQNNWYNLEVRPPRHDAPPRLDAVIEGISEKSSKWLGLKNASSTVAYEIRRPSPTRLKFVYSTPSKRLDRKLRNQLTELVPTSELVETECSGLPVHEADSIGLGRINVTRNDWHPLNTEFSDPPTNQLAGALHRNAMKDTRFVIQFLFKPLAGERLRRKWWRRKAFNRGRKLRKKKQLLIGERSASPVEKKRAKQLEQKATTAQYEITARIVVIGADEYTASRLRELSGVFNQYRHEFNGQTLGVNTFKAVRATPIYRFLNAVADRERCDLDRSFNATVEEAGALASLPNRRQPNITEARP